MFKPRSLCVLFCSVLFCSVHLFCSVLLYNYMGLFLRLSRSPFQLNDAVNALPSCLLPLSWAPHPSKSLETHPNWVSYRHYPYQSICLTRPLKLRLKLNIYVYIYMYAVLRMQRLPGAGRRAVVYNSPAYHLTGVAMFSCVLVSLGFDVTAVIKVCEDRGSTVP